MARSPDIPRQTNLLDMIGGFGKPVTETDDGWIKVGDSTDEISPPFQGAWGHATGGAPVSFFLDPNGVVRFRGDIAGGTDNTIAFTLPVGFRPEYSMTFISAGLESDNGIARIKVDPNGDVTILSSASIVTSSTLDPGSNGFWKTVSGAITRVTTIAWSELTGIPSTFAPSAHKNTHKTGGSDAFVLADLLDAVARIGVRKNSAGSTYSRRRVNFIEGSNVTITVADDATDEEVDVTITSTGGAPSGSAGGALDGSYPNPGLAASVAGAGLAETSDVLSVNVDGSTIEISSDILRVKADGITANEIASAAVGPSELASTTVTAGTYGDATHVGQFTVDADGRLTSASSVPITGGGSGSPSHILLADGRSTPFSFNDMLQYDDGSDFMWSDPE